MGKDITRTVDALCEDDDAEVFVLRAEVESRVAAGEFDWVGGLAVELAARVGAGEDGKGHCGTVAHWALHALAAHPEPESLRALVRVMESPHHGGVDQAASPSFLAAVVAGGHRVETIADAVFGRVSEAAFAREFAACLLQESVLVQGEVDGHPALRAFADTLLAEDHPLAVLPLSLLPEEHGLRRPPEAADDWTWMVPPVWRETADPHEPLITPSMRRRAAALDPTETGVPATADAMGAAVEHWLAHSNGTVAAQEFWLMDPVAREDFPAVFELLPLTPWPADGARATLHPSDADLSLRILLTAAVRAPAYGRARHGAYGRLAAWRSLGGLTGSPADAPVAEVAELVRRTSWFRIGTSSPWFHDVAWDLAVAALRPGGREIAVLAATDTD
ncbi:hypothetical protein GCM10018790_65280 [Kitasatospora xanthocidica]|uniref:DUF6183 family protein n=1 Tax=Kitasatospora xanthocidica TaxID=83382 RepID=UPI001679F5ED|nr:DUF6183 family protein [Kitasatospora xanthocidica]GHF78257.1 hypothetical protein GCM10018790_65280 [Kitasatospora xanthocidica]